MKLTIIVEDDFVSIDDFGLTGFDLSSIDPDTHAVQWHEQKGHVEYKIKVDNDIIDSIDQYQDIIDQHAAKRYEIENPVYTKEETLGFTVKKIVDQFIDEVNKPWYYGPKDSTFFFEVDAATTAKVRSAARDLQWRTADIATDGVKSKKVTFNVPEMNAYADATVDRAERFALNRENHVENVQDIYLDPSSTVDDILNYDYSSGWE